jgi:anti-sigma-K factor RskA
VTGRGASLSCEECRTLLGGYVLDALEPDETADVRAHLASCDLCAREQAQLGTLPSLLDTAAGIEATSDAPPATLEEAVMHGFVSERPPRRQSWLRQTFAHPLPAAATAAAVAAVVTLAMTVGLGGGGSPERVYGASLRGLPPAATAHASARLESISSGTRVELKVAGLHPAPDAVYELWCIRDDGTKMSAGTFRVDQSGKAYVHLTTAARLGDYHRLSVERTSPHRPGMRVMAGEVEY